MSISRYVDAGTGSAFTNGPAEVHNPDCGTDRVIAVTRVLQGLRDSLESGHSLLSNAAVACYSPYHFHRLFVQVTSTTPARFLAALRMEEAKLQLASTDRSVATVCCNVGYGSLGTFTSQFTRLVGLSPGNFRRLVDRAAGQFIGDAISETTCPGTGTANIELSGMTRSQVGVVGLFASDIPQGIPLGFTTLKGECRGRVDRVLLCATNQVFAVAYPAETGLADVALGRMTDVLVGHRKLAAGTRSSVSTESREDPTVRVTMCPPLPTHPPIVSCAAAIQMVARARG